MSGKLKAAVYLSLAIALSFVILSLSGRDVIATDWEGTYATILDDPTPFASSDSNALYNIPVPPGNTANFARVDNATNTTAGYIALDTEIPDGQGVGDILSLATLGLINGACSSLVPVPHPFMDGTTDITNTIDWIGGGDNLVQDDDNDGIVEPEDSNGIPSYADHYPSYLNTLFTNKQGDPIRPRARYVSHAQVITGAPPTHLNFVVFNPGDLGDDVTGLYDPESGLKDTFGYVIRVVLNNEAAPSAPSTITEFCAPLTTDTDLKASTIGEMIVAPGPAPYEVQATTSTCRRYPLSPTVPDGFDDNDGEGIDGFPDDGCLFIPDPCMGVDYDIYGAGATSGVDDDGDGPIDEDWVDGIDNDGDGWVDEDPPGEDPGGGPGPNGENDDDQDGTFDEGCGTPRMENPAPLTGVYGTGTHITHSYSLSLRDADSNATDRENAIDLCPYDATNSCPGADPFAGPTAINPDGVDNDGDGNIDEDKVNNADDDGDGLIDEDGECLDTGGLPDQDQDCYPNRGDNCPFIPNDQRDLDALPEAADGGPPADSIGDICDTTPPGGENPATQCANNLDDDGDTRVNDGCPIFPAPPNAFYDGANIEDPTSTPLSVPPRVGLRGLGSCGDAADNGGLGDGADAADTDCYDGQEIGAECMEPPGAAVDDDGDGVINDGCPAAGGGTADGHYHADAPSGYRCIAEPDGADNTNRPGDGTTDTDGDTVVDDDDSDDDNDGACDSTEQMLNSDPTDAASLPEFRGLVLDSLIDEGGTVAPQACSDFDYYNEPDSGPGVDNDGDTLINGADSGCAVIAGDADDDGVPDSIDNCIDDDNPEQMDTDGDGTGDDCENPDADGDGISNAAESYIGTDPKDNCADNSGDPAHPSDADNDADIDIGDVIILFLGKILSPPDYQPRSDMDADGDIDIGDVIIGFLGKILLRCDRELINVEKLGAGASGQSPLTLTNNTGQTIDDIHIQFMSRAMQYKESVKITGCGAPWVVTYQENTVGLAYANRIDATSASGCADGGTIQITANTRRTPVVRCYDWTSGGSVVNGSPIPCNLPVNPQADGLHMQFSGLTMASVALGLPALVGLAAPTVPPPGPLPAVTPFPAVCPVPFAIAVNFRFDSTPPRAAIDDHWDTFNICDIYAAPALPNAVPVFYFPRILPNGDYNQIDCFDFGWSGEWDISLASVLAMEAGGAGPPRSCEPEGGKGTPGPGVGGPTCYPVGGTSEVDDPGGDVGWTDDGCPAQVGPPVLGVGVSSAGAGEEDNCFDNDDDDADGWINENCPQKAGADDCDTNGDGDCTDAGEGGLCADMFDSDFDGWINDGCPLGGAGEDGFPELDECDDAIDDDADTDVNDGCLPILRTTFPVKP